MLKTYFDNINMNTTPILSSIPVNHCFIISHPKASGLFFYFAHRCHEAGIQRAWWGWLYSTKSVVSADKLQAEGDQMAEGGNHLKVDLAIVCLAVDSVGFLQS